jgi:hypothetical protein
MNANAIYRKTERGAEEMRARKLDLPPKLRTMLILIDGTQALDHLQGLAEQLGAPKDFLAQLEQRGLIEAVAAVAPAAQTPAAAAAGGEAGGTDYEGFRAAQKFMIDTVVNALGVRALFFTLKLEKCSNRAELSALVTEYAKAVAKGSGPEEAEVLAARVREMLR